MRADAHDVDAHAAGPGGALVIAHHPQVGVKRRQREQQPPRRGKQHDQQHGREYGGPKAPACHELWCHTTGAGQDHQVDAGQCQKPRQRHDDRLHPHPDHDGGEQKLVQNPDADCHEEHAEWARHHLQPVQFDDADVDEGQQRPHRQINRAATRHRQRHQRIGGQRQRGRHDDRRPEPRQRHKAGPPHRRDAQKHRDQQDRHQQIGACRGGSFRHAAGFSSEGKGVRARLARARKGIRDQSPDAPQGAVTRMGTTQGQTAHALHPGVRDRSARSFSARG